jgi:hypothetical protein
MKTVEIGNLRGRKRRQTDTALGWVFRHRHRQSLAYSRAMGEQDPRAKYRVLPANVDSDDMVIEVDTELAEVEHGGKPDFNEGADPYLRITGWLPPR